MSKVTISPDQTHPSQVEVHRAFTTPVLQDVKVNMNLMPVAPSLEAIKPFLPMFMDIEPKRENAYGPLTPLACPHDSLTAQRTALGWSSSYFTCNSFYQT